MLFLLLFCGVFGGGGQGGGGGGGGEGWVCIQHKQENIWDHFRCLFDKSTFIVCTIIVKNFKFQACKILQVFCVWIKLFPYYPVLGVYCHNSHHHISLVHMFVCLFLNIPL